MQDIGIKSKGRRLLRLGIVGVLAVALVIVGMFLSGVVLASHNFSDVPTTAFYHNAVEWVKNRGITAGCAVGLYCPNDAVTRGTMAVFLQKEGQVLTPQLIDSTQFGATLDINTTAQIICQTTTTYTPTFPQQAVLLSRVDGAANGPLTYRNWPQYSTDGGTTWLSGVLDFTNFTTADVNRSVENVNRDRVNLNQGTGYRFAVEVDKLSGTGTQLVDWGCVLHVDILNRNPATTPLAPSSRPASPERSAK